MNYQGKIKRWEDKRGFGFIQESQSSTEIFAHISAFHVKTPRPQVGEEVSFNIATNDKGKKEAQNIRRYRHGVEVTSAPSSSSRPYLHKASSQNRSKKSSSFLVNFISMLIILISGYVIYEKYLSNFFTTNMDSSNTPVAIFSTSVSSRKPEQNFRCDGRIHCSQMRSCAEAKFFLKNCPGVKMDGDKDGTPCEQQWCTGLFD